MNDFDRRVTDALSRTARRADDAPDWDDLSDRIDRHDRGKHRARSLSGVAALVAVALVGTAVAVNVSDGSTDEVTTDSVADQANTTTTRFYGEYRGGIALIGADGVAVPPTAGSDLLFAREMGDTLIEGYIRTIEGTDDGVWWWDAPDVCQAWATVNVIVSDDTGWSSDQGMIAKALRPGEVRVSETPSSKGRADNPTFAVVTASVPREAVLARATFPGGETDEMEPVQGFAAFTGPTDRTPLEPGTPVVVEAFDANGELLGSGSDENTPPPADCAVPPEPLPEPGAQPADAESARAEITEVFDLVYDGPTPMSERKAGVDDSHGWEQVEQGVVEGGFADMMAAAQGNIRDIVFVSPTRAAFRYDIVLYPMTYGDRIGYATLVDGEWKIERATACRDVGMVGGYCP